ncbi:MAG TPA: molybdopterin-dependent oxidoreductase [Candidatus Anoxymicrobiaceae bacterium]
MRKASRSLVCLIALLLALCAGCSSGAKTSSSTPLLPSEARLNGMYEHCKTIQVKDGSSTVEFKTATLPSLNPITVNAVLKRSNGMHINGTWKGTPLGAVLDSVGVARPFKQLRVEAWDSYVGRVAYDVAARPDTILAYEQDGKPLPKDDGPARLVVASEDGFFWIRMITRIEVVR